MAINAAKDRADQVWQKLQTRAREFIEAEEGLVASIRELLEENGISQADITKKLEEFLGKVKANKVWDKVSGSTAVVALSDYREEIEKKAEDTRAKVLTSLKLASISEVEALEKQLKSLNRKVNEVNRKVKALSA
jgi:uncharacterized protein (DUF4213/DUF364 family)